MRVLGIDTSAAISVGLVVDGHILAQRHVFDPKQHAELAAPMVREVLAECDATPGELDAVVIGTGPGPFTGLRVGIVTGRSLALGVGIPVYGMRSLDAVAADAYDAGITGEVVVVTDARRKEVYFARYCASETGMSILNEEQVGVIDSVPVNNASVVGRGAVMYAERIAGMDWTLHPEVSQDPDAATLARLISEQLMSGPVTQVPDDLEPRYLRRPDVQTPGPRKRAL